MHREQIGAKQTDEGMWLGSPEKETEADPKRITFDDLLCRFDTESERKKKKKRALATHPLGKTGLYTSFCCTNTRCSLYY
ncbi:hypothetical protein P7H09_20665 [Paenibacillus larvae]|uniref:Uncharacterized protein n=2 Tax=Paenibacillus larvae TaxID=1464 RepID=A0AAP5JWX9_9BACL|nr:hypothetical protein [Paenibacillus larvae]